MTPEEQKLFKKVYEEYYALHPSWSGLPKSKYYYLHREWIFPNHIDSVLKHIELFHKKHYPKANITVALYAGLLHDSGLVYKRTDSSPIGHENRSCEYATIILKKYGFNKDFISAVCEAIEATEPKSSPKSEESFMVRNADAYSHLTSIHFIAKAHFAEDIESYIEWFTKKIETTYDKLTIQELKDEVLPTIETYRVMIKRYNDNRNNKFI